jgi:hypothetical protein
MKKSNDILMPEFERLLNDGHMVEFVPRGVSMRPFIEGGVDKVILHICKRPMVGMIVLARIEDRYVLHRIYKIDGKKITLRGDGNLSGSETCTAQDIIGCVVRIKNKDSKAKSLTPGTVWRHLPTFVKRLYLKIYRIIIKIQSFEHDED